jgi:hypothetical protein
MPISIYIQLKIRQVWATKMIIPEHMIQSNPIVLIRKEVDPVELCTYIHSRIEEIGGPCNHIIDNTFHFTQARNDLEMPIAIGRHRLHWFH